MATLRPRNDPVKLLGRRLGIAALFLLVIFVGSSVWGAHKKERESAMLRAQAEAQLHDVKTRESQLEGDIAKLETARGKEEALREQYAVAARGEGLIVIVDPHEEVPEQATSTLREWLHKAFPWW